MVERTARQRATGRQRARTQAAGTQVAGTQVASAQTAGARARREFIRANHPDRGGDPAVFVAGLAALDRAGGPARRPGTGRPVRVVGQPDRSWLAIALTALARRAGWPTPPPRVRPARRTARDCELR